MKDTNERSVTSDGSVDAISVLRKLVDGVRGMTFGDPDSPDSIEASTIVRWAIDEIEQQRASIEWYKEVLVEAEEKMARMRLTDAEREAVEWASKTLCVGWHDLAPCDKERTRATAATLRGLLERLK
jgi:hypothetical protein